MTDNKNKITDYSDPDFYNLMMIDESKWKYKVTFNSTYKKKFDGNKFQPDLNIQKYSSIQMKRILKFEKTFTNVEPIGFIALEVKDNEFLHYHCIFSDLKCIDSIKSLFPTTPGSGWLQCYPDPYRKIEECGTNWIGYILKRTIKESIYYTPSLMREIKYAKRGIRAIEKQTGLIDERNLYLMPYLSKERIRNHTILSNFKEIYERD